MRLTIRHLDLLIVCLAALVAGAAPALGAPSEVTIGAYINDIQGINLGNNTHVEDFYVWYRWKEKDQDPSKGIEYMNPASAVDHSNAKQYDPPIAQPNGEWYTVFHHQGAFSSKFPLQNYPFDHQILTIEIEDAQLGADQRVFVPDKIPVKLDAAIHLPGYEIGEPGLTVRPNTYPMNFGDMSATGATTYSRATITIPVRRPWVAGVLKVLLPIGLILISAILGLAVRPDHVEARIGLGITSLLTMVALQFTSAANLPEVSYLMLIDKVYIASYMVIIAVLGIIVRDSWAVDTRGVASVAKWNRRAVVLLVSAYLIYIVFNVARAIAA